jgi:NADP-reducing hydrogenase subunit HndB
MTINELKEIKENYIDRRKEELGQGVVSVDVHMGTCGIAAGARNVFSSLEEEISRLGLTGIRLRVTGCAGLCSMEPMITVQFPGQSPVKYGKLDAAKTREIFYSHILGGHPKQEYAIGQGFEKPQKRVEIE